MKSLTQTHTIRSPIAKVWQALVNPHIITQWGGGPAKMDTKVGTEFSLWGGDIHGRNTKVVLEKLLEQDWYGGDWKAPSKVVFSLISVSSDITKIVLTQTGIPDEDFSDIKDGWQRYYLNPLTRLLEDNNRK